MLELPVTALSSDVLPAVALKLLDEVTNLHAALRPKKRRLTPQLSARRQRYKARRARTMNRGATGAPGTVFRRSARTHS
jgi:hypothetical protein